MLVVNHQYNVFIVKTVCKVHVEYISPLGIIKLKNGNQIMLQIKNFTLAQHEQYLEYIRLTTERSTSLQNPPESQL